MVRDLDPAHKYELNAKIEELNNKLVNMKQSYKLAEKKEIMRLNEKISYLNNEVELKQSKIEFIDKRHKNLQVKYLKLLGDKRKMAQENMSIFNQPKLGVSFFGGLFGGKVPNSIKTDRGKEIYYNINDLKLIPVVKSDIN